MRIAKKSKGRNLRPGFVSFGFASFGFASFGFVGVMTLGVMILGTGPAAMAQAACAEADVASRLPEYCQREKISASGDQRPTQAWALRSAEDKWQDQVITKYGERYARSSRAACLVRECVPAALRGFKRCTVTGYPCSSKPSMVEVYVLSRAEIREMQQLLNKAGIKPRVSEDGRFGPNTQASLERWQRRNNYPVDGNPSLQNLNLLRR